ncbi:MAG: oligosaccharide flippase family protein [Kiritimatiellia bacterium]
MTVPVIAVIGVFHQEVVTLAFGRGRFDGAAVRLTALLLLGFAPGILFGAFQDTLNRVHYASQDSRTPMVLSACAVAVKIGLSLLLVRHYGVLGLALATCAAAATYSLLQFVLLKHSLGFAPFRGMARIGMQTLLAGAVMAVVGFGVRQAVRHTGLLPSTTAGVGAALLVYGSMILALRVDPALHFAHSLRARLRHRP